jgi:hypothetical protein
MDATKPLDPVDPLDPLGPGDPDDPVAPVDSVDHIERGDAPEPSDRARQRDEEHRPRAPRREPLNLDDLFDL